MQKDTNRRDMDLSLSPDQLLGAYMAGCFPMADPDDRNRIRWYAPDPRAVLPILDFKPPKSLRARIRKRVYHITRNQEFDRVIDLCASREETWISEEIIAAYRALHRLGYAHSIEAWENDELVGGLYGVAINGLFCGESMFSNRVDASKVALVYLVEMLIDRGFVLLDIQFMTEHLRRFGAIEIPREEYEKQLRRALSIVTTWN
ncbi:MAG: leucyl/phenylalanyl-tRNA--protein transferase [Bacteroidetes bacterium]|nr:leucyl/phenylalanyl-tRNA--protein transferase [Bacteroidota bacterium]